MMDSLKESLHRIEDGLVRFGRTRTLNALRPGLSASMIDKQMRSVGLLAPWDLAIVYNWRDGTDTTTASIDDVQMFPGFYLLSLTDALADYNALIVDPRWHKEWLPLFSNGGGDFYIVDLSPVAFGRVRHFRFEHTEHPIEFLSVADLMMTVAEAYDREAFFIDSRGFLEMDDSEFALLAAEVNPDVPWWTK